MKPSCLLALAFLVPSGAGRAQRAAPPLLVPAGRVPAAARAWDAAEKAKNPAILRSTFVRVDTAALGRIQLGAAQPLASFTLDLFGKAQRLDIRRVQDVLGYRLYVGAVRGRGGDTSIVVAPDGVVAATIHLVEDSYAVHYAASGDVHVLQEVDDARSGLLPRVLVDESYRVQPPDRGAGPGPLDGSGNTILDVMVFYTPRARQSAGGKTSMEAQVVNAIALANATNKASSVAATFRLVYTAETNYTEDGSTRDLTRFRSPSDGAMDEVHGLRNTYGGDLMHLITEPARARYCGVAYLMTTLSTGFRAYSFGVTLRRCMGGNVVTHEMGHNIGCHHDRRNAGRAIYPYAYGFRTSDNRYRTIMAYSPGRRVNVWSSPNVKYLTYVMGKANSEDNARTITNTKATVARFTATKMLVWCELSGGIRGSLGLPVLSGDGTINRVRPISVTITRYRPRSAGLLLIGAKAVDLPFFGGSLVPSPDIAVVVSGSGAPIKFGANALSLLPRGAAVWFQAFFLDQAAVRGVSGSNGMKVTIP